MNKRMKIIDSLRKLRDDAISRGMLELAIVYGWSGLELYDEEITERLQELELK